MSAVAVIFCRGLTALPARAGPPGGGRAGAASPGRWPPGWAGGGGPAGGVRGGVAGRGGGGGPAPPPFCRVAWGLMVIFTRSPPSPDFDVPSTACLLMSYTSCALLISLPPPSDIHA